MSWADQLWGFSSLPINGYRWGLSAGRWKFEAMLRMKPTIKYLS
jgi:hypothetical protein